MRIGTWNVEYASPAKNERRLAVLRAADADVWVLTETRDSLDLSSTHQAVHSDPRYRTLARGRWVTIWSRFPLVETVAVPDTSRTVAALYETTFGQLLVYGTVLPWHSDRGPTAAAKTWAEHHRVIPEQAKEWLTLCVRYPRSALCVAGDLNMNLGGRHYYGTKLGRQLLEEGLREAGIVCVTRFDNVPSGKLAKPHIDHVCLPLDWAQRTQVVEAWPGAFEGVRLSDHSGLVVAVRR